MAESPISSSPLLSARVRAAILQRQRDLANDIMSAVDKLVTDFHAETGVEVDDITIYTSPQAVRWDAPLTTVITRVSVGIKI